MYSSCPICLHELDAMKCCQSCRSIFQAVDDSTLADALAIRRRAHRANRLAAAIDLQIYHGQLDPRSMLSDIRLDYGDPFTLHQVEQTLANEKPIAPVAAATVEVELQVAPTIEGADPAVMYKTQSDAFGRRGLRLLSHLPPAVAKRCQDGARFTVTIRLLDTAEPQETPSEA